MTLNFLTIGCAQKVYLPPEAGFGAHPTLPPQEHPFLPTVNVVKAIGWPVGQKPVSVPGTSVTAFSQGLDHPRWIYVLPNGDVLVAETNAPERPEDSKGIKAWFMKFFMKRAGGATPSANRITLLRDADGDGVAEIRSVFLEGLTSPFGMELIGSELYIADTDAVLRFPYVTGALKLTQPGTKVVDLPAGLRNHHWTKNIIASKDGTKLYVSVGSNSDAAQHGMEIEESRAAIWEMDLKTGLHHIFASGLRNPVGLAWEPVTGALWAVVNERDELGNDLVPDYITSINEGDFYGWPYSYQGQIVDTRIKPQRPDLVAKAKAPDYALGSHTASLGLTSAKNNTLPKRFANGMFIGQHGSWNRKPRSGYKVIFVPFSEGRPLGQPIDVLTGFVTEDGDSFGRPVGVAIDQRGGLLVADDVGNFIWRVGLSKK